MSSDSRLSISLPAGRSLGGVTTWTIALADRLAEAGCLVRLLEHPSGRADLIVDDAAEHSAVDCVSLEDLRPPNNVLVSPSDIADFAERYSSGSPEVFLPNWSWGAYAAACAVLAEDGGQSKIVSFVHADGPDYYDWAEYYETAIARYVAVSEQIRQELVKRIPHRADDIAVLPYPVEASPHLPDRNEARENDPLLVVYAGRISHVQKRIGDLVGVIRELERRSVHADFRIIGGGPDEAFLRSALEALDRDTVSVRYQPPVPTSEMASIWHEADVCLLTSEYEGTSISMLEAMAAGAIPVVTNVSGTDTLINDGRNGLRAPVGNIERLADHLAMLAADRSLIDRMSRSAHNTIVKRGGTADYDAELRAILSAAAAAEPRMLASDRPLLPGRRHARFRDLPRALRGDRHAAKRLAFCLGSSRPARPLLRLRSFLEHRLPLRSI